MGRAVRRVPPNWEHPRWKVTEATASHDIGEYRPCFDRTYDEAAVEWIQKLLEWECGIDPDRERHGVRYYWEWTGDPPQPEWYRPAFDGPPTWFQYYETTTEGTPMSPPFATEAELIDYLVEYGDLRCQRDHPHSSKPTRAEATGLVVGG